MKFLFDLGGIFFDWSPKYFFDKIFTDKNELNFFLTKVCNEEWNIKQDAGRKIQDAEYELITQFPNYKEQIKLYYSNHHNMIRGVFQESIDLLIELKSKKFQSYVLSNWSAETFKGMTENYPFLKLFDGMLISGEYKLIKPDPSIYKLAIKLFNIIPEETVFIDDKKENIEAANDLNFITIHITNPNKIKDKIKKYFN